MRKNILFFVLALALCLVTAPYFGAFYDKFSPQYGSTFWGLDKGGAIYFVGFLLSYIVLISFLFELFGVGNKKKWISWSLLPVVLFLLFADTYHIYLPIILGIIAFLLAKLINFLISKIKRSNV